MEKMQKWNHKLATKYDRNDSIILLRMVITTFFAIFSNHASWFLLREVRILMCVSCGFFFEYAFVLTQL